MLNVKVVDIVEDSLDFIRGRRGVFVFGNRTSRWWLWNCDFRHGIEIKGKAPSGRERDVSANALAGGHQGGARKQPENVATEMRFSVRMKNRTGKGSPRNFVHFQK